MGEVENEAGDFTVLVATEEVILGLVTRYIDKVALDFPDNEGIDTEDTESSICEASVAAALSMSISIIKPLLRIPLSSVEKATTLGSLRWRRGNGLR